MLQVKSILDVADNSGAKEVSLIGVTGYSFKRYAEVGDVVNVSVKKTLPGSQLEKGQVVKCVVIRTRFPIKRRDGSYVRFDSNAAVLVDEQLNPKGSRIFGPVPRELRQKHMKIISLAPEVV